MSRNKRTTTNKITAVVLCLYLVTAAVLLSARPSSRDSRRDSVAPNPRLQEFKKKVQVAKGYERGIMGQIQEIDEKMDDASRRLENSQLKLQRIQAQERLLKKQLARENKKYKKQRKVVAAHLVDYYKNGRVGYLEVLFNSASMEDFMGRTFYMRTLFKNKRLTLMSLRKQKDSVLAHKTEVEEAKKSTEEFAREVEQRQQEIAVERAKREYMLKRVMGEKEYFNTTIQEMEKQSLAVTGFIRMLPNFSGPVSYSGRLTYPVYGRLTSPFGYRRHPVYGSSSMHTGIDIAAPMGTPIAAADSGTVIYTGWRGGYGNTVIVQHSKDLSTLYAHGSRIATSNGAHVKRGELIMYVGSTGLSTGPHLHFEVRVNGNPVNPMSYF